jgi:hypothetical protein
MNNEPISDDAMMHFIASCFAMNGMLAHAGHTQAPDAATLAKLSNEYAHAMMQRNKNIKKNQKSVQCIK